MYYLFFLHWILSLIFWVFLLMKGPQQATQIPRAKSANVYFYLWLAVFSINLVCLDLYFLNIFFPNLNFWKISDTRYLLFSINKMYLSLEFLLWLFKSWVSQKATLICFSSPLVSVLFYLVNANYFLVFWTLLKLIWLFCI